MSQHTIIPFEYEGQQIEFDLTSQNVMVNATEMAKAFDKKVDNFTRIESTQNFISECLNNANKRFISVEKEEDLIISRQKSGTWMHRILALKFAAWLNPKFELWVYATIDDLLFGTYKRMDESLKQSAERKKQIEELKNKLEASDEYKQMRILELEERQASYARSMQTKRQIELFKEDSFT